MTTRSLSELRHFITDINHLLQGRRQDFCFGGANLAAKGSPAGSAAPGIARGVWEHAPPENFEILGCLKCILRQVETVKDNKKILHKSSKNMTSC